MLQITLFDTHDLRLELPLASEWNELSVTELIALSKVLGSSISREQGIIDILTYRLNEAGLSSKIPSNWAMRLHLQDFVLELNPYLDHFLAANTLTNNPLPLLGELQGPANFMDDMLCGEFEVADTFITLFVTEKNIQHLITAISYLWRPKMGEKRVPAKDYEPSENVKSFLGKEDNDNLHLIYLWWVGCRQGLQALFPMPFGQDGSPPAADVEPDASVFTKAIHNGAGERNGSRVQIRWETLVKEFLFDLQLQLEQQAEQEEKMKQT